MKNSFESLSPGAQHFLRSLLETTTNSHTDRDRLRPSPVDEDDDPEFGARISASLRELNSVMDEILGVSPEEKTKPSSVTLHDDGFSGFADPDPSPEDNLSFLVHNRTDLPGLSATAEELDANLPSTLLPFDFPDAEINNAVTWTQHHQQDDHNPSAKELLSPFDLDHMNNGNGSYFLECGNGVVPEEAGDILAADVFVVGQAGTETDSAYNSSPSASPSSKPHSPRLDGSSPLRKNGRNSFDDGKRKKVPSKPASSANRISNNVRRVSTTSSTTSEPRTNQYRGMSQRDAHNAMERERRVQLRENFEALRAEVPSLRDADKAATLQILREATAYIKRIRDEEKQLLEEKAQLIAINDSLRKKATVVHDDDSDVPPLLAPPS